VIAAAEKHSSRSSPRHAALVQRERRRAVHRKLPHMCNMHAPQIRRCLCRKRTRHGVIRHTSHSPLRNLPRCYPRRRSRDVAAFCSESRPRPPLASAASERGMGSFDIHRLTRFATYIESPPTDYTTTLSRRRGGQNTTSLSRCLRCRSGRQVQTGQKTKKTPP